MLWFPDYCPSSPSCVYDARPDWSGINSVVRTCTFHQSLGLSDSSLFTAAMQTNLVKEAVRTVVKNGLALTKAPSFTVAVDGEISIISNADAATRTTLAATSEPIVATINKPIGTSNVRII